MGDLQKLPIYKQKAYNFKFWQVHKETVSEEKKTLICCVESLKGMNWLRESGGLPLRYWWEGE